VSGLIPPGQLPNTLITGRQKYDDNQGDKKGNGTGNAPLPEYDAKVFRGPGEEHLNLSVVFKIDQFLTHIHITLPSPIHISMAMVHIHAGVVH
jgi:hypothetical protein